MNLGEARTAVGAATSGDVFGQTSKMPGKSYGLPAKACLRGSKLAEDPRSMCHPSRCYAKRNFYASWGPVIKNREAHLASIVNPDWDEAMVLLMTHFLRDESVFRWHDSGDLQSVAHLAKICRVAAATPWLDHWIPTHEPFIVLRYVRGGGVVPPNLTIRLSADRMREAATVPEGLRAIVTTSSIHVDLGHPTPVSEFRKDSVECKSYLRDHKCGPCRACWSRDVKNVSYPLSGSGGAEARAGLHKGRPQVHLRVVA